MIGLIQNVKLLFKLFLDHRKGNIDVEETDDENMPKVSLQEMLDDLHISTDDPMGDE